MQLKPFYTFDDNTYRHYVNGHNFVMHCHHYMSLVTALAEKHDSFGGVRILQECVEDAVRPLLEDYVKGLELGSPEEAIELGVQYYSLMGLGRMEVKLSDGGAVVILSRSHVDEGWVKKWGKAEHPVNHATRGYVAAMFAAAYGLRPRAARVTESNSIAMGEAEGRFTVELSVS